MAAKLSRRALSTYVSEELLKDGDNSKVVMQLAAYLVETHRTKELGLIIRDIQFYLAQQGSVSGVVTTAFDLSSETLKAIESYVQAKTSAKSVTLDSYIDSTILGGIKINLPGQELDRTISRNLTILKTKFKKA